MGNHFIVVDAIRNVLYLLAKGIVSKASLDDTNNISLPLSRSRIFDSLKVQNKTLLNKVKLF